MRYEVTGESLTSVADAIRERAGTTEAMAFPDGFVSAVESVPDTVKLLCADLLKSYSNEKATTLKNYTFREAKSLEYVYLPNVTGTGYSWFAVCHGLHTCIMPKVNYLAELNFASCRSLKTLDFHVLDTINVENFKNSGLETLILRKSDSCCKLLSINNFTNTPIASGTGYIYVPRSLVDSYKAATNWSTYANQIRAIEDYPEITGG